MTKIRMILASIFILLALTGEIYSSSHMYGQALDTRRYFPETGYGVRGRFLDYWEQHGGLPQQGYPISEEMQERSDTDGKTYTVQYFERAVFELHPENKEPYDVLLSLLGTSRYKEKYAGGAHNQKPNQSAGSVYFPQTGKRVGGSFMLYWNRYGGLAQQGYPVSDEIEEKSDLDGKTYTVQYFERAVMEWHPGNTPPYDVLLSQLGRFRYDAKYKSTSTPISPPSLIIRNLQDRPTAIEQYLFYTKGGTPYSDNKPLYGYNLDQDKEFLITDKPGRKFSLASDGRFIAWTQLRSDAESPYDGTIHGYDLSMNREFTVPGSDVMHRAYDQELAVDRGMLYYRNKAEGRTGLYRRNLITGEEKLISARGIGPMAADGMILWLEPLSAPESPGPSAGVTLYLLKGDSTQGASAIFSDTALDGYSVSGNSVVWGLDNKPYGQAIFLYNIATDAHKAVAYRGINPIVRDNKVVWVSGPATRSIYSGIRTQIEVYDTNTGAISTVVEESDRHPIALAIGKRQGRAVLAYRVFTEDQEEARKGVLDLYITGLDQGK